MTGPATHSVLTLTNLGTNGYWREGGDPIPAGTSRSYSAPLAPLTKTGETGTIIDSPAHTTGALFPYREVHHTKSVYDFSQTLVSSVTKTVDSLSAHWGSPLQTVVKQDISFVCAFEAFDSGSGPRWNPTFPVTDSTAKAYVRSAMNWTDPLVKPELSLVRAVAELKDFEHIFKSMLTRFLEVQSMFKVRDYLGNLFAITEGLLFSVKKDGLYRLSGEGRLIRVRGREVIAGAINADFLWKFAIAPLISDIQASNRILGRLASVTASLKKVGKPYFVRGSYADSVSDSEIGNSSDFRHFVTNYTASRTVVGWAAVRRDAFDADTIDALVALGDLRLRMSTLWELTPLSFVVDWFVSVGNALRAAEGLSTSELPLTVLSSGYSFKTEITGSTIVNPFAGFTMLIDDSSILSGEFTSKVYSRVGESISPSDRVAIPPPSLRFPNLGKLWTLTELIFQVFYLGRVTKKT